MQNPSMVRANGSSKICTNDDSCAVRSQPSEQCTRHDRRFLSISYAHWMEPYSRVRTRKSHFVSSTVLNQFVSSATEVFPDITVSDNFLRAPRTL